MTHQTLFTSWVDAYRRLNTAGTEGSLRLRKTARAYAASHKGLTAPEGFRAYGCWFDSAEELSDADRAVYGGMKLL